MTELHEFADRESLAQALAHAVAQACGDAPFLAVSGGSTPLPFFAALKPLLAPKENVTITLTDERWVEPTEADSNEKLVREHLLLPQFQFLPLKSPGLLEEGTAETEHRFAAHHQPFDAVILGMGEDGHTASLFPHHPALALGLAAHGPTCLAVTDSPKPPPERITLTYARLIATKHLFLHITGAQKRELLLEIMKPHAVEEYPIRAFLQQTSVKPAIYWAP